MRQILLVKTSSLGDVVHNLPVVSDIRSAFGEAAIDWVVETSFASIPAMHPGVRRVIPCELRAWRRAWVKRETRQAWRAFVAELRSTRYDCVIDTQGLLKSAIVTRAANGWRVGLDWRSSREPLRLFYDQAFNVPWTMHAVERNRRLAALALGYELTAEPRYGIGAEKLTAAWLPGTPYVLALHATSHPRKLWPEERWTQLGTRLSQSGLATVLPWGDEEERLRAERLAVRIPGACVAPRLRLAELAGLIAGARGVVGVDTGLTHLAAALGIPVVGIYGATDPQATGVRASTAVANLGSIGHYPAAEEVLAALIRLEVAP